MLAPLIAPIMAWSTPVQPGFTKERQQFESAIQALEQGRMPAFERLRRQLRGYPLTPYLDHAAIKRQGSTVSTGELEAFIRSYPGFPLNRSIRERLVSRHAKAGRWAALNQVYEPRLGVAAKCRWLQGLAATGRTQEALDQTESVWLSGRSRPDACDRPLATWIDAGRLTPDLAWSRVNLAMQARNASLLRYLRRFLPRTEQRALDGWLAALARPEDFAGRVPAGLAPERLGQMTAALVRRLAVKEPVRAARVLETVMDQHSAAAPAWYAAKASVGRGLAQDQEPGALRWLRKVPSAELDERSLGWRIAAAARQGQWRQIVTTLDQADIASRDDAVRWHYWRGRALLETGDTARGRQALAQAAKGFGFYQFLAANRLAQPYDFMPITSQVSAQELKSVAAMPGVQRAYELLQLGRRSDAHREWRHLLAGKDPQFRTAAARLARQWGWYSQAVLSSVGTPASRDLDLRFPTGYQPTVERWANHHGLDPSWVFATIRQESAFMQGVRSSAGALGLMQLMPGTARYVAKRLGRASPSRSALLTPGVNVELGTTYMADLMTRFSRSPVLASAAYNAGPARSRRWQPRNQSLDADVWIENVPFRETRGYLRRVLAYTVLYDYQRQVAPRNLLDWIGAIRPRV